MEQFLEQELKLEEWVKDGLELMKSMPNKTPDAEYPVMDEIHNWGALHYKLMRCFIDWYQNEALEQFPENLQPHYKDWYKMFGESWFEMVKNYKPNI